MENFDIPHFVGEQVELELQQNNYWVVANIDQNIGWPEYNLKIIFEGHELYLLGYNTTHNFMPAVCMKVKGHDDSDSGLELIAKFLSRLCWVNLYDYISIYNRSGGSRPFRTGLSEKVRHIKRELIIDFLPCNLSDDANLALALFREGNNLWTDHKGYSFLSYYKIINLVKPSSGEKQKKWMQSKFSEIKNNKSNVSMYARDRLEELEKQEPDIANYLYTSCRCALAHAGTNPVINPDNFADIKRLSSDLDLIKYLAIIAITEFFEVKTSSQVYDEHKYELFGFIEIIDNELLDRIVSNEHVGRRSFDINPNISIRLRLDKRYGCFENLKTRTKLIKDGIVHLECYTEDRVLTILLLLDFRQERMVIVIDSAVINPDSGKKTFEYAIDYWRFYKDLLFNGELVIYETDSNKMLGRKEPNIPVNIDPVGTEKNINETIEKLEEKLSKL